MPDLDIPVVAARDELLGAERVGGDLEDRAQVAEVVVELLLGVRGRAAVDVAVHGAAVIDVGVLLVEVDRQPGRLALELRLGARLLGRVRDELHLHEVAALEALVDGPLLDEAVHRDRDQELALVVVVDPLDLCDHVRVRAVHVAVLAREDVARRADLLVHAAHVKYLYAAVQLPDRDDLGLLLGKVDGVHRGLCLDDAFREGRVFERVEQDGAVVLEVFFVAVAVLGHAQREQLVVLGVPADARDLVVLILAAL